MDVCVCVFVRPSVRPGEFNTPRSLPPTPLPTVLIVPKALLSDVTYLSFLRRRRYYLTLPICHFAPKALLSDITYLSFLRRRRYYRTLPICHFCAEGANIGRYLAGIFAPKARHVRRDLSVIFAPMALLSDFAYLSFLRRRRYFRTLPICHFCAEGANIGRYLSVIFAPKALLSDVTSLSFLRRKRYFRMLPICYFCAEGATIGRYLSVIFAPVSAVRYVKNDPTDSGGFGAKITDR